MAWLRKQPEGVAVEIVVQPRASRTEIVGLLDDRLKIRLKAPPVDGAANKELTAFLAKTCGVAKSKVTIAKGSTGKRKTVIIEGVSLEELAQSLETS